MPSIFGPPDDFITSYFPAGSQTEPSVANISDPDTGIYWDSTNSVAVSTGGTKRMRVNTADVDTSLPIRLPAGSATSTAIGPTGDPNTGIYFPSADAYNLVVGGNNSFTSDGTTNFSSLNLSLLAGGSAASPRLTFNGTTTGLYASGFNILTAVASNQDVVDFLHLGGVSNVASRGNFTASSGGMIAAKGTASNCTFRIYQDENTGINSETDDTLDVVAGGTKGVTVTSSLVTMNNPARLPAGTTSAPSLNFTGNTTTGLSAATASTLDFSCGGTATLSLNQTASSLTADEFLWQQAGSTKYEIRMGNSGNDNSIIFNVSGNGDTSRFNITNISNATSTSRYFLMKYNGTNAGVRINNSTTPAFVPDVNNAMELGNSTRKWDQVYARVGSINTSDSREKKDIQDDIIGLDFINDLKPVSYKFKTGKRTHYGLLAQDVEQVVKKYRDFGGYIHDPEADMYGLRYSEFIAPMIKAIQELSAKVDQLEKAK